MLIRSLSLLVLCAVVYQCHAKPAQVLLEPLSLSPVQQQVVLVDAASKREQRSPQFGFPNEGFLEDEYDGERRHKHHKHHLKREDCLEYPCGEYPEYPPPGAIPAPFVPPPGEIPPPFLPPPGEIPLPGAIPPAYPQPYPEGGAGESFASASSGSNKGPFTEGQSQANAQAGNFNAGGNPYTEGQSQSNAQSASFNFGPYSASFSVAESSSGGPKF
ncbi:PREDICTED: ena/VASP-like protein [Habropoda laboriosa]|uniref:ena/VASP-like protein n=1 Tax=Habropoda laboriosa TaxID=597456 RepID=UPI00083D927E|nr:PREDICTED: ena/VASP-like protein [Habropoda laboriosa]